MPLLAESAAGKVTVAPASHVRGDLRVPGDKSIAHRALLFAALAEGRSRIDQVPPGADVAATISCLRACGIEIAKAGDGVDVDGHGLDAWTAPGVPLDCANSGTTMRMLLGVLACSRIDATLAGDASLSRRPMERVVLPLRAMGAQVEDTAGHAPLTVSGRKLVGRRHTPARASAQVKSALLLAGLHAAGTTVVVEPIATRDHSERLLSAMGASLHRNGEEISIDGSQTALRPLDITVPGDLSSAAFLLAAASLRDGWSVSCANVGLNPTRTAFLGVLREMGAELAIEPAPVSDVEPRGRVTVTGRPLRAISLDAARVAAAIDEIPILLAVASQAEGTTSIEGAAELRVKESDRLGAMADGLRRLGVPVEEGPDWIRVHGPARLHAATLESHGDHRIAMALAVAALVADGPSVIDNAGSVAVSFPGFFASLSEVTHG